MGHSRPRHRCPVGGGHEWCDGRRTHRGLGRYDWSRSRCGRSCSAGGHSCSGGWRHSLRGCLARLIVGISVSVSVSGLELALGIRCSQPFCQPYHLHTHRRQRKHQKFGSMHDAQRPGSTFLCTPSDPSKLRMPTTLTRTFREIALPSLRRFSAKTTGTSCSRASAIICPTLSSSPPSLRPSSMLGAHTTILPKVWDEHQRTTKNPCNLAHAHKHTYLTRPARSDRSTSRKPINMRRRA